MDAPEPRPSPESESSPAYAQDTIERWAADYLATPRLADKLAPPPIPAVFADPRPAPARLLAARDTSIEVRVHGEKSTGKSPLRSPERRARLMHTFLHHELQAAELMAWALLAFPEAPTELRRGLVRVIGDEIRHMGMYAAYLRARGFEPGCFPVRDWFWERLPSVPTVEAFLATLGLGFEGANLDHALRFAARFRAAGDEEAARIEERVGLEEVPHVRFALRWFLELTPQVRGARGQSLFDAWCASLPAPLSPIVMRGAPIARDLRRRAGLDDAFVDALERYEALVPS